MAYEIIGVAGNQTVMAERQRSDEDVRDRAPWRQTTSSGGYVRSPGHLRRTLGYIVPTTRDGNAYFPKKMALLVGIAEKSGGYFNCRYRRNEKPLVNHVIDNGGRCMAKGRIRINDIQ